MYGQEEVSNIVIPQNHYVYFGIFFGIIIFNIIISFGQYILAKDKAYFFYALYVLFNFLYFSHYYEYYGKQEIFFTYFFDELSSNYRIGFLLLGYVMYHFFAIEFLKLRERLPSLAKTLRRFAYFELGILVVFTFCYQVLGFSEEVDYDRYKLLHDLTILSVGAIGLYGIFLVCKSKISLASILIVGVLLYFIGSVVGFVLTISPVFKNDILLQYPLIPTMLGFLFEISFFAIGLAYRAFLFEKEKEETNEKYIQKLQENQQLELERKDALKYKEINEFKSQLYTNITHEFRTPLTVIMGMAEQLEENPKLKLQSRLQTIRRNGNQLLELVNQLLYLSKLEEGSLELKIHQGKIINFLRYLTESYQSFALSKQRGLSFYSEVETDFLMDYDAEKIQRILINLISNAIKFTPELGQVKVSVKKDDTTNFLRLRVKDTGQGIPADALPKIFDRFYQVDASNTRNVEGTGIGLALVKEMTELFGGRVVVESEVGKGTTFDLFFPIKNETPIEEDQNFEEISIPIAPSSTLLSEQVEVLMEDQKPILLIIEDNQDVAEYLQNCLTPHYQFVIAQNGRVGVEEALDKIPDIIISDVMMPEMNGFEVCEKLKTDPRTNHIPIIMLTAKSSSEDRLEGLSKGADAYLFKPFNKKELMIRLEHLVEVRKNILEKNKLEKEQKPEDEFLQKMYQIILDNIEDDDFDVPRLCKAMELSRTQIHRKVKATANLSTTKFIRIIRLQEAKRLIQSTDFNISEVAYKVGYKNPANFSTHFKSHFGFSPSETHN